MSKPISSYLRGFTLLELMIVIVILGILATIVMPRIMGRPEQARRTKAVAEIKNIESALAYFKLDVHRFPTTAEGLDILTKDTGLENYRPEAYLPKVPLDQPEPVVERFVQEFMSLDPVFPPQDLACFPQHVGQLAKPSMHLFAP